MLPYTIDEIKRRITPVAQKYSLAAVYLFGSYARGEATAESDVDLLVDLSGSTAHGMLLGGLYADLEEALQVSIDLVTVASLHTPTTRRSQLHFRDTVAKERLMIYDNRDGFHDPKLEKSNTKPSPASCCAKKREAKCRLPESALISPRRSMTHNSGVVQLDMVKFSTRARSAIICTRKLLRPC